MICAAWTLCVRMSVRISFIMSDGARSASIMAAKRLGVVDHRAEGLSELMGNRGGQRRHRLTAAGVSRERQVPLAVALGLPPRATLMQQSDNQKRLDEQRAHRAEHGELVFLPQAWDSGSARRCRPATGSPRIPHRRNSRQSKMGCPGRGSGTLMLFGGAPFNSRAAASTAVRTISSMCIIDPPTAP